MWCWAKPVLTPSGQWARCRAWWAVVQSLGWAEVSGCAGVVVDVLGRDELLPDACVMQVHIRRYVNRIENCAIGCRATAWMCWTGTSPGPRTGPRREVSGFLFSGTGLGLTTGGSQQQWDGLEGPTTGAHPSSAAAAGLQHATVGCCLSCGAAGRPT